MGDRRGESPSWLGRNPDPRLEAATSEVEFDTAFQLAASRILLAHPVRYAALCAFRFLLLWFNWGYLQAYGKHPGLLDYGVMGEQALLLLLALVGCHRLGLRAAALAASVASVTLLYMEVIGQLRFLIPLMPLTMTLAAAGPAALWGIGRRGSLRAGG